MGAAIVERGDLDVLGVAAPVRPFVLQSEIWEVDVAVEEWQIVLMRPLLDLPRSPVRTSVGI